MAAMLQLPRSDGFALELPDAPGLCETCRERPRRVASPYCDELCRLFDAALAELADAYAAADGDRLAAPVVLARTRLRLVSMVYDRDRLPGLERGGRQSEAERRDWLEDVAAGELLPLELDAAIAEVRRLAGIG